MKVSGSTPKKSQIPSKHARPTEHTLLRQMMAEHAALMNETLHLIREVRDLVSHISGSIDANNGSTAQ